jgi:hypothetical protein
MTTSAKSAETISLDERGQAYGIAVVIAAGLIGLTVCEAIMHVVNRSPLPDQIKLLVIRTEGLVLIPAIVWIGWTSRALGSRKYLAICASVSTAYLAMTQSRGLWIWAGTFDNSRFNRAPWIWAGILGLILAFAIGSFPAKSEPDESSMVRFIAAMSAGLLLEVTLSAAVPVQSEFATLRWLFLLVSLIALLTLYYAVQRSS